MRERVGGYGRGRVKAGRASCYALEETRTLPGRDEPHFWVGPTVAAPPPPRDASQHARKLAVVVGGVGKERRRPCDAIAASGCVWTPTRGWQPANSSSRATLSRPRRYTRGAVGSADEVIGHCVDASYHRGFLGIEPA